MGGSDQESRLGEHLYSLVLPGIAVAYQKALYGISGDVVDFTPYVLGTYRLREARLTR